MPSQPSAPDRSYLLDVTLVLLLITGPSLVLAVAFDMDSGSIAEWVSSLGTVGALFAAIVAARAAFRTLQRDQEKDRRLQAEKVAAWPTRVVQHRTQGSMRWLEAEDSDVGAFLPTEGSVLHVDALGIALRNASELPVTNVKLWILMRLDDRGPVLRVPFGRLLTLPVLAPSADFEIATVDAIAPIDRARFHDLHTTVRNRVEMAMRFTDAAGVEWFRTIPGGLARYDAIPEQLWALDERAVVGRTPGCV